MLKSRGLSYWAVTLILVGVTATDLFAKARAKQQGGFVLDLAEFAGASAAQSDPALECAADLSNAHLFPGQLNEKWRRKVLSIIPIEITDPSTKKPSGVFMMQSQAKSSDGSSKRVLHFFNEKKATSLPISHEGRATQFTLAGASRPALPYGWNWWGTRIDNETGRKVEPDQRNFRYELPMNVALDSSQSALDYQTEMGEYTEALPVEHKNGTYAKRNDSRDPVRTIDPWLSERTRPGSAEPSELLAPGVGVYSNPPFASALVSRAPAQTTTVETMMREVLEPQLSTVLDTSCDAAADQWLDLKTQIAHYELGTQALNGKNDPAAVLEALSKLSQAEINSTTYSYNKKERSLQEMEDLCSENMKAFVVKLDEQNKRPTNSSRVIYINCETGYAVPTGTDGLRIWKSGLPACSFDNSGDDSALYYGADDRPENFDQLPLKKKDEIYTQIQRSREEANQRNSNFIWNNTTGEFPACQALALQTEKVRNNYKKRHEPLARLAAQILGVISLQKAANSCLARYRKSPNLPAPIAKRISQGCSLSAVSPASPVLNAESKTDGF